LQALLNYDYDVYLLTYDKLRALLMSSSPEAKELLEKLWNCDVFILDEFTTAILVSAPTLVVKSLDEKGQVLTLKDSLKILRECSSKVDIMVNEVIWGIIDEFLDQFENIEINGITSTSWIETFSEDDAKLLFKDTWRFLTKLTEMGFDTTLLQEVVLVMFSRKVVVSCENGTVKVTPKLEDALGYLKEFIGHINDEKTVFLVDSYQPNLNFDKIFEKPIEHLSWGKEGDPLQTNTMQLLVPDTAHWGSEDFLKDISLQKRVKIFLEQLVRTFSADKILIVTTNKRMASVIAKWNLPKEVRITWFRSDWMRGVQVENRRIMVCVGGPYLPKDAYIAASESFRFEDFAKKMESLTDEEKKAKISRLLTYIDTKSEFINAIGRVKDPLARKRSVVFTLGMTILDVRALLRRHERFRVSQPHIAKPYAKGGFMRDGLLIAQIWMKEHPLRYLYHSYDYAYTGDVKDLPLLGRIIRVVRQKTAEKLKAGKKPEVTASEIVPGKANVVVDAAKRHEDILKFYGIKMKRKRGGVAFCLSKIGIDIFLDYKF